jgi:hypothetical protein
VSRSHGNGVETVKIVAAEVVTPAGLIQKCQIGTLDDQRLEGLGKDFVIRLTHIPAAKASLMELIDIVDTFSDQKREA